MHSLAKFVFILLVLKIDRLQSRAILYPGNGCTCGTVAPVATLPLQVPCPTHGYKIEVPPPAATAQISYTYDVNVEEPVPVLPRPACNMNLYATIKKLPIPASDCVDAPAPLPVVLPAPPPAIVPTYGCAASAPLPAVALLPAPTMDDFSGVAPLTAPLPTKVTYHIAGPPPPPAAASLPLPHSLLTSGSLCGSCSSLSPRYVLNGIYDGRSKRDVSTKKQQYIGELLGYVKSLKTSREARKTKKSKLVKRDIKGEYDLLEREQAQMDLTIPDIIQYMPETMMPNFKRGKCNIGCKNCINKDCKAQKENEKSSSPQPQPPTESVKKENDPPIEPQPQKVLNENNQQELPNKQFDMKQSQFAGANYLKRSVNPFQSTCYPGLMPPPYIPSTMEMAKLAQNPGNPIWYQPRPLIDPNGHYVYDRLGHKYEVKNGSLKLVTPHQNRNEEVIGSAPYAPIPTADESNPQAKSRDSSNQQKLNVEAQKAFESAIKQNAFTEVNPAVASDLIQTPIVGAPTYHDPSYDPNMDKVIRDIVYRHPDFIDATQHAPGSLTLPEDTTRDETMEFLDKLIRGRLNTWFGGPSEGIPMHNLHDLNRYSRETGTSVKFIPIVTVDKDRLNKYRQEKAKVIS